MSLLLPTCVSVKRDSSMESLPVLQDIQSQSNFQTFPFVLDFEEGTLQVQPEAYLL